MSLVKDLSPYIFVDWLSARGTVFKTLDRSKITATIIALLPHIIGTLTDETSDLATLIKDIIKEMAKHEAKLILEGLIAEKIVTITAGNNKHKFELKSKVAKAFLDASLGKGRFVVEFALNNKDAGGKLNIFASGCMDYVANSGVTFPPLPSDCSKKKKILFGNILGTAFSDFKSPKKMRIVLAVLNYLGVRNSEFTLQLIEILQKGGKATMNTKKGGMNFVLVDNKGKSHNYEFNFSRDFNVPITVANLTGISASGSAVIGVEGNGISFILELLK